MTDLVPSDEIEDIFWVPRPKQAGGNWTAGVIYQLFTRADERLGNKIWTSQ